MVLCLKAWESRSLPGLHGACEVSPEKNPQITMTASAVTFSAADFSRPFAYLERSLTRDGAAQRPSEGEAVDRRNPGCC